MLPDITTAECWDEEKPLWTLNVAFTHKGLAKMGLPASSLLSFPTEFVQGMRARADILGDTGRSAPEYWDPIWLDDRVHAWVSVNARTTEALEERCAQLRELVTASRAARPVFEQNASSLFIDGKATAKEHFGYADGFSNPSFEGDDRDRIPGQGKLTADGKWVPLATGEFLLEYADEAGELPPAPLPYILARNGTFMVYRKLHQNVATFRRYLEETGRRYPGGKEKLASKLSGRWRDGTPVEHSPDRMDPTIVADKTRNTSFTFGSDLDGTRCPIGAHVRRVNPRDTQGFNGRLVNRRRIIRRGLPYGPWTPEDQPGRDDAEHGIIFMALNASLYRQFEFIQQQWIDYGNDALQGNDKDPMVGNHDGKGKFMIQGKEDPRDPPFLCAKLPSFVELRGGDYFFVPSLTALQLIAGGNVDTC